MTGIFTHQNHNNDKENDQGRAEVESHEEEGDNEDCQEGDAQGLQRVLPHGQVLLVEHVEDGVGEHGDMLKYKYKIFEMWQITFLSFISRLESNSLRVRSERQNETAQKQVRLVKIDNFGTMVISRSAHDLCPNSLAELQNRANQEM